MWNPLISINRKLRSLSLKSKLFLIIILLSLIPTLFVSFVSQYLFIRSSSSATSDLSSQIVKYIANDINSYLVAINESLNTFVIDSEFQKFITVPKNDLQTQTGYAINFRPMLQLLAQSKKEIRNVLYIDNLGKIYSESQKVFINIDYPMFNDPFYIEATQMVSEGLLAPHKQSYGLQDQREVISFVKPINRVQTRTLAAWIIVEIDAQWIWDILSKTKLGEKGQVLLHNPENGKIIQNNDLTPMARALNASLNTQHQPSGEFIFSYEGSSYQVTYDTIPLGKWRFVGIIPLEEMAKGVQQSRMLTFGVALISLLLALLVAYPAMSIVLKPLYQLKRGMQMLGRGTSVPIEQTPPNEIGFLIHSYNQMLGDLKSMRQEVVDSKLKEKERELLQLQAQINPHFLFNTLETIESYSLHNNSEAVSSMLQCVSRMLRYNVRNDGGIAPLREEMLYIRDFLSIHSYRNEQQVNTDFHIEPELLELYMMKQSIQPLVENSLKYGWIPGQPHNPFQLKLSIQQEGDRLVIEIQDNGKGIPEEIMHVLQLLTQSDGDTSEPFFKKHTGIWNVYRRFRLAYDSFRMTINYQNEALATGTLIRIHVPIIKAR